MAFHLKGGTSLSKGFRCIHRFSEDIDLRIEPDEKACGFKVYAGKNHDDEKHRASRRKFFDWVQSRLHQGIPGIIEARRDESYDDKPKLRNGGIRLFYPSLFGSIIGLKDGILLEVGFDRTAPNRPCTISSWAYEHLKSTAGIPVTDNRAIDVSCYEPRFTFVEKLQAVVRKFRLYKEGKTGPNLPENFIRHYYDLFQLIDLQDVKDFIGTPEYDAHKAERFGGEDTRVANSDAFTLSDPADRARFEQEYERTRALFYAERPSFQAILGRLGKDLARL